MDYEKLRVKVKLPTGDILEYEVSPSDTLQSLRTKLKESQGIDEKDQHLGIYGRINQSSLNCSFLPTLTFEQALIKDGDTLRWFIRKGGCRLFIKTQDGKVLEVDADGADPVWNIKRLVEEQTGYPVEKQKLFFAGKNLEDHRLIADYGFQRDSTFHLVLK